MNELAVFAKYWQPGSVKTRLAADVGTVASSQIHRAMLDCTLKRFCEIGDRRVVTVTPAGRGGEFQQLAGTTWLIKSQTDGDLGTRMEAHFNQSLRSGADHAVLIGSDSPTLPVEIIDTAFRLLREHQVVLGPSDDGGYYLIGLSNAIPPIFVDIDWSTASVWQQTVDRLAAVGCSFAELPSWYDVDTMDDLKKLRLELCSSQFNAQFDELSKAIDGISPQTNCNA